MASLNTNPLGLFLSLTRLAEKLQKVMAVTEAPCWFWQPFSMSSVVLTPVAEAGYWRVKITWPTSIPRYFGHFDTQEEAEKWIADHRWLIRQNLERQAGPPEITDPTAPNA